jgi:hypothetical protein
MKTKCLSLLLLFLFVLFQSNGTVSAKGEYNPMTCEEKLNLLEPSAPKTMYDYDLMPDRDLSTYKEEVLPIPLVQKKAASSPS